MKDCDSSTSNTEVQKEGLPQQYLKHWGTEGRTLSLKHWGTEGRTATAVPQTLRYRRKDFKPQTLRYRRKDFKPQTLRYRRKDCNSSTSNTEIQKEGLLQQYRKHWGTEGRTATAVPQTLRYRRKDCHSSTSNIEVQKEGLSQQYRKHWGTDGRTATAVRLYSKTIHMNLFFLFTDFYFKLFLHCNPKRSYFLYFVLLKNNPL